MAPETRLSGQNEISQALARALALHQAGNLAGAEALYRDILASDPQNADALRLLGTAHFQRGDHAGGIRLVGLSLEINPHQPVALSNYGAALQALKRYDEALASFSKAIALNPGYGDAYINRGVTLHTLKRYDEALASYDKAVALQPNHPEAHYNRGLVLHLLKRHEEALASYDKAIALKPDHADAFNNRGHTLHVLKRVNDSLASYERAIALRPGFAEAWYYRGIIMQETKRYEEALASYQKAVALDPDISYLPGALLSIKMLTCDWKGIEASFDQLAKAIEAGKPSSAPFTLLATPLSMALQRKCTQTGVENVFPPGTVKTWNGAVYAHDKIRIGYFSADFHNHPTTHLMAGLFERHDRSRFEIIGFSYGPRTHDDMQQRLEKACDDFIDVSTQSDHDIAALAQRLEIDIAVDLKGFTQNARNGIFAQRPAPVQVHYLGYPGTTAASFIDYLIADAIIIPQEHRQYYSEKIVCLPNSYQVNDASKKIDGRRFTREEAGLPENGFVFCCFNNSYKITPDIFDVWMRLLHAVAGSVLWLLEDNPASTGNLRAEALTRGIAGTRLVFAPRMELAEHLARQRLADLFLDTFYCNAHTTASDALWAGLPLLTCLGGTFAGRVAASLLYAAGLPELVAHSHAEYETLALALATDPQQLSAIRDKLAQNRVICPLFDTPLFTRHIEDAYVQMQERARAGVPPGDIVVQG